VYDLVVASDDVKYVAVAVDEDRHRQSVVPGEVEHRVRLSITDHITM